MVVALKIKVEEAVVSVEVVAITSRPAKRWVSVPDAVKVAPEASWRVPSYPLALALPLKVTFPPGANVLLANT